MEVYFSIRLSQVGLSVGKAGVVTRPHTDASPGLRSATRKNISRTAYNRAWRDGYTVHPRPKPLGNFSFPSPLFASENPVSSHSARNPFAVPRSTLLLLFAIAA
jgi:hypothetical protein